MPKTLIDKIFSCTDLTVFTDSVVVELPFNGSSGSKFYVCEYDTVRFLTKLCFYSKIAPEIYGIPNASTLPITDTEIKILQYLKKTIIHENYTRCILEIIDHKVCVDSISQLCKVQPAQRDHTLTVDVSRSFCRQKNLIKAGLSIDKFALIIMERCDITFSDYMLEFSNNAINIAVFKSLLFQVIHALYVLKKLYSGFRHYDLHDENVMLKFDAKSIFSALHPKFLIYPVGVHEFVVPYFGITPKIIDFGFSSLPEINAVSAITMDRDVMYNRVDNEVMFLFYNIHYKVDRSSSST